MDSSTRMGSPADDGVAAARTKSQRGVITAVPKELSLGFTRWTLKNRPLLGEERWFTECLIVERISTKLRQGPSAGQEYPCRTMLSIIQS